MPREGWPKESSSGSLSTDYSCFDGSGLPLPFADCTNTERCISTVGVDLETSLWESEGAQVFADGVATPRTAEWKRQNQPGKEMHSWLDTARDGGPKASRVAHTTMKQKEPGEETRGLVNCLRKTIKLQERDTSGQGRCRPVRFTFARKHAARSKTTPSRSRNHSTMRRALGGWHRQVCRGRGRQVVDGSKCVLASKSLLSSGGATELVDFLHLKFQAEAKKNNAQDTFSQHIGHKQ